MSENLKNKEKKEVMKEVIRKLHQGLSLREAKETETLGRRTTIPLGCQKQQKDLGEVIMALDERGFRVKGREEVHQG